MRTASCLSKREALHFSVPGKKIALTSVSLHVAIISFCLLLAELLGDYYDVTLSVKL